MCVTNSQTIAPVQLYFHPEVRTHAHSYICASSPTNARHPTYAPYAILCRMYMNIHMIRAVYDHNILAVTSVTFSDVPRQEH